MKTKNEYIYEQVSRVPNISDEEIAEMRHIVPLLKKGNMYREIKGSKKLDPKNVSFIWDAKPTGPEFTFEQLNITRIVTQHHSSIFFKPSLAEVYAWIRVYMPCTWKSITHFCLLSETAQRIGSSTDIMCQCEVMGGKKLVRGNSFTFASGATGYNLVEMR